jgi:hypothetical protein
LREIDGGSILVDGIDVAKNPDEVKQIIGVQPQTAAFQDKQRLSEIIEMFAAAYGERVNVKEFLDDVELGEKANDLPKACPVDNASASVLQQPWCIAPGYFSLMNRPPGSIPKQDVTYGILLTRYGTKV